MSTLDGTFSGVIGTWHLVAERRVQGRSDIDDPTYEQDGNGPWMRTSGAAAVPPDGEEATEVHGLTLTIAEDGTFTESGESTATVFDADGVETAGEGFSGRLEVVGSRLVAFAGDRVHEPVPAIADPSLLRLSDGSVDIAELFETIDEHLVRTQNVVTDGIYLVRSVLVYSRTAPAVSLSAEQPQLSTTASDGARQEAEAALVASLLAGVQGDWKEIVAYANADGSQITTVTFSVNADGSGHHHLSQDFRPDPRPDLLWKEHRATTPNQKGKKWGTAVVVVRPPDAATWQVDYRVSRVLRGEYDETYHRYKKYLPIFLDENGLDR